MAQNQPTSVVDELTNGISEIIAKANTLAQGAENAGLAALESTENAAVRTALAALNDLKRALHAPLNGLKAIAGKGGSGPKPA